MRNIEYIGKRKQYTEGCYGSRIEFVHNKAFSVEDDLAAKLLKHPDQFIPYDPDKKLVVEEPPAETKETTEDPDQDLRDSVQNMTKTTMIEFAEKTFAGFKLNPRLSVSDMKIEVIGLIDRFGAE